MKKNIVASYVGGIFDATNSENYTRIIRYFIPEFITAFILYCPTWIDAAFIAHLKSTPTYATLGTTNNFIHLIIKIAEAFSVGTVIMVGQRNGAHDYPGVGKSLRDAFWTTIILGLTLTVTIFFGAFWIYKWVYKVPEEMITLGLPFMKIRALSVFFMFVAFAFVGFLRGIKNTRVTMILFMFGGLAFVIFDYLLIFGADLGFVQIPSMGLQGSAIASIIQYCVMVIAGILYISFSEKTKKYSVHLFTGARSLKQIKELILLSLPVVADKAVLALSYVWLCSLFCQMGIKASATYSAIKDLERFAIIPGVACAQIITFLVSNDFGQHNWQRIKNNIKKMVSLAISIVSIILVVFVLNAEKIIGIFDKKGEFTAFAAIVFCCLAVFLLFDVIQLVLSGALRGAGDVRTVMLVRMAICLGYFVPFSYFLANYVPVQSDVLKFVMVYGSFYAGNAIMSIIYIHRFRSGKWKKAAAQEAEALEEAA